MSAFLLKSLLDGFLSDTSMLGMMSIEIIENVGVALAVFTFVFSGVAVFFSNKRRLKKSGYRLWNKKTSRQLLFYLLGSIVAIALMIYLKSIGYSVYLGISFLLFVAGILIVQNTQKKKPLYLLAFVSLGLAALSYFIPSYWYSSLLIMGAAFIVYGIMIRE